MSEENKRVLAEKVFGTLCLALDNREWKYDKDEEKLLVSFGVNGDDIPMRFLIHVDEERMIVRLMSPMQFNMSEDKRVDGAIITGAASYSIVDGCFDYDMSDGRIVFRMTESYRGGELGEFVFHYMISCACSTVDEYNDRFLAVNKGHISVDDFIKNS